MCPVRRQGRQAATRRRLGTPLYRSPHRRLTDCIRGRLIVNDAFVDISVAFEPDGHILGSLDALLAYRILATEEENVFLLIAKRNGAVEHVAVLVDKQWACSCSGQSPCLATAALTLRDYAAHQLAGPRRN